MNGQRRQTGNTADMIFPVAFLISHLSQFMTLLPGDVIATGTPSGVGAGCKPPEFLKPGDVIELGVEGLGRQRQDVVAYAATPECAAARCAIGKEAADADRPDLRPPSPGRRHACCSGDIDTQAALADCIAHVNRLDPRPDLVLATGDLADGGTAEDYAAAARHARPAADAGLSSFPAITTIATALRATFADRPATCPPAGRSCTIRSRTIRSA